MPIYFPTVEYGSRLITHRGLGSLRSARRRQRRLLGQDVGSLPFTADAPVSVQDSFGITVAAPGSVQTTEPAVPSSLDASSFYAAAGIPSVGGQPAITAIGSGPGSGVTYMAAPASSTPVASFFSTKNSVLGISNGWLIGGAAVLALLAAAGGGRR